MDIELNYINSLEKAIKNTFKWHGNLGLNTMPFCKSGFQKEKIMNNFIEIIPNAEVSNYSMTKKVSIDIDLIVKYEVRESSEHKIKGKNLFELRIDTKIDDKITGKTIYNAYLYRFKDEKTAMKYYNEIKSLKPKNDNIRIDKIIEKQRLALIEINNKLEDLKSHDPNPSEVYIGLKEGLLFAKKKLIELTFDSAI